MEILRGLTREESLKCVYTVYGSNGNGVFVRDGVVYGGCPVVHGFEDAVCCCDGGCYKCWRRAIADYFDKQVKA